MSLFVLSDKSTDQSVVTRDGNALADALNSYQARLRIHTRAQGFYGDVERCNLSLYALGEFVTHEATPPGRKLLIWLGPGWSLFRYSQVVTAKHRDELFNYIVRFSTALREARVTLYNINPLITEVPPFGPEYDYYKNFLKGVDSANEVQRSNLSLQVLAVQSGGQVINATNDIAGSIARCLEDAKAFYTLSFNSPIAKHSNEYHSLQVKVSKPGLTARTRMGYYLQIFDAHGN